MHFVHEFVEVVFVALAEVDEGLDRLVGVGGDVLLAAFVDNLFNSLGKIQTNDRLPYLNHVVDENRKVCDAVVDIRRLVNPNKWLIEDREEIPEQL